MTDANVIRRLWPQRHHDPLTRMLICLCVERIRLLEQADAQWDDYPAMCATLDRRAALVLGAGA